VAISVANSGPTRASAGLRKNSYLPFFCCVLESGWWRQALAGAGLLEGQWDGGGRSFQDGQRPRSAWPAPAISLASAWPTGQRKSLRSGLNLSIQRLTQRRAAQQVGSTVENIWRIRVASSRASGSRHGGRLSRLGRRVICQLGGRRGRPAASEISTLPLATAAWNPVGFVCAAARGRSGNCQNGAVGIRALVWRGVALVVA